MRCIFYHRDKQGKIINGGGFANAAGKAKAKSKKKPKKQAKTKADGSSCVAIGSDAAASALSVPTMADGSDAVASATATGALQQSPLEQ